MARQVVATLRWDGPYENPNEFAGRAGVFIVIAAKKDEKGNWLASSYKLLDICSSATGSMKLAEDERMESWKRATPEGYLLIFKFAPMPTRKFDLIDRQIVETCMRKAHYPLPCGSSLDSSYLHRTTVVITNVGKFSPLQERCFHSPEEK